MANDLSLMVPRYTQRLDRVLAQGTKTSFLNVNDEFIGEFVGHGTVMLPTFVVQGLGDYSRTNGHPQGSADITWKPYELRYDRGRKFDVDEMDDEERLGIFTANVMGEFARSKVVPEVDATRFALLAQGAGEVVNKGAISTASDAWDEVLDMEEYFEDKGIALSTLTLNLTSAMKRLLREAMPYRFGTGADPNTNFETFDDMRLNVIPADRFYTAIELLDGTTSGEEDGGYQKATLKYAETEDAAYDSSKTYYTKSGSVYTAATGISAFANGTTYYEKVQDAGKGLNFLVAAPGSAAAINKHEKLRYFSPDVNQEKDAHKWDYRLFHDLLVYDQKKSLIYANVGV